MFTLDGIQSVSSRDHILRETISNLLAHRDFASKYVAKLIIEKDRICLENANLSHNYGVLELSTFQPVQKNPPISKVFREIGLADELGSGMRNTYKYTRLYSGAEPQFVEGDIFKTIIPLKEAATATVGPVAKIASDGVSTQAGTEASDQASDQVSDQVIYTQIICYCEVPRTKKEICVHFGYNNLTFFTRKYT